MELKKPFFQLGKISLSNRYVLAPMAGITNAPFRLLMREVGAGCVVSELISSTGLEYGGQKTLELCRVLKGESPVGLQIFGENADHLVSAALKVQSMGCDFVDINLGCPVPKVVSRGGGAAMLKDPKRLHETLRRVREAIEIPLTIKIRTGWDSSSVNAHEIVAAAAEAGVNWIAVHGRTRAQGYEGFADWDLIAEIKSKASVPIIGNGDILTAEQAVERLKGSGCDAVMIGRGALRDPFIFRRIAELEGVADRLPSWDYWELILRHHVLLIENFSDFYIGIQLRKFMAWFSAGMPGASTLRKKLYEVPNGPGGTEEVLRLGKEFFDHPGLEKVASFLREPFLQGGHG